MRTTLSTGEDVRIVFRHMVMPRYEPDPQNPHRAAHPLKPIKYGRSVPQAVTQCKIVSGTRDAPVIHGEGITRCSWLDHYVKEMGRQLSLKRAIAGLSARDQYAVTHAYETRPRTPPFQADVARELLHMAIVVRETPHDASSVDAAFEIFARLLESRAADLILARNMTRKAANRL